MSRIVGIDFGTTNTRLQLGYSGTPERAAALQLPNADRDALPSVILLDEGGQLLEKMGRPAERALLDPTRRDRVRYEFKPCLGRSEQDLAQQIEAIVLELRCPTCNAKIPEGFLYCGKCGGMLPDDFRKTLAEGGLRYEREEAFNYARLLLSEIGKSLRRTTLGGDGWEGGDRVVVGVPAHWTEDTRRLYAELVAEALGIGQVEPVEEPRAALVEYLFRARGEVHAGDTALVVDVGGGTTDLVAGKVRADGTLGDDAKVHGLRYGGSDFDERVVKWAMRQATVPEGTDEDGMAGSLRLVCRNLKEELSDAIRRNPDDANPCVVMHVATREMDTDLTLDRATFESDEVAGPLIGVFGKVLIKGLAAMGLEAEGVGHVILVGGGSNAYFVEDVVRATFPNAQVVAGQQPEVAISRGLVLAMGGKPPVAAKRKPAKRSAAKGESEPAPTTPTDTAEAKPRRKAKEAKAPLAAGSGVHKGGKAEAEVESEPAPVSTLDTVDVDLEHEAEDAKAPLAEAVRYISLHRDAGSGKDEIRDQLRGKGWSEEAFEKAWRRDALARAVKYVRQSVTMGYAEGPIMDQLRGAGWGEEDAQQVWRQATGRSPSEATTGCSPTPKAVRRARQDSSPRTTVSIEELFCPKCGRRNLGTDDLCGGCGESLEAAKDALRRAQQGG